MWNLPFFDSIMLSTSSYRDIQTSQLKFTKESGNQRKQKCFHSTHKASRLYLSLAAKNFGSDSLHKLRMRMSGRWNGKPKIYKLELSLGNDVLSLPFLSTGNHFCAKLSWDYLYFKLEHQIFCCCELFSFSEQWFLMLKLKLSVFWLFGFELVQANSHDSLSSPDHFSQFVHLQFLRAFSLPRATLSSENMLN